MKLVEKQREDTSVRRIYDPAKTPLQRLLLSGVLPAHQQDALAQLVEAIDPVCLFEHLKQLQQAMFRCEVNFSPGALCCADPLVLPFVLEDCTAGACHVVGITPDPAEVLETLHREPPQNVLDWKRTSKNPFAEEWEQILAWVQANPERTSANIFRELQHRSPGHYRPAHLRTLQRGIRQIRTQLLETREVAGATEAMAGDVSADHAVSTPLAEEIAHLSSSASANSCSPEPSEARSIRSSPPPAEEITCSSESTTRPEEKRVPRQSKRRHQTSPTVLASRSTKASPTPLTVDSAIQLYLQDLVAQGRSLKTVKWHRTALGLLQAYLAQTYALLLISQLTRQDMHGWVAFLCAESPATGTQRAANTLRTYVRSAHAFGSWLVQQGYEERSPFYASI